MWKRLLVIGFSAGAGFAIVSGLTLVGWNWYQSRPRPPRPWDSKAITTEFSYARWSSNLAFVYLVTNNTQMDYKLAAGHNMKLVIRTKISARSLPHIDAQTRPDNLTISLPVFVPARETARLRISLAGYPKPDVIELGRAVKRRYPRAYADLGDAELGRAVKLRSPGAYDDFTDVPIGEELVRDLLTDRYPLGLKGEAGTEKTNEYIKKELQGLAGFVLFDEERRYRIEFPDGWSEQGE